MEDTNSTLEARATRYRQLLQDEGYAVMAPDWKEETLPWMMRLRYEGVTMFFLFDAEDPSFVGLILPNFFETGHGPTEQVFTALDRTNNSCKGAKIYLNADAENVMSSVELLDDGTAASAVMLLRYLAMLLNGAKHFAREMQAASGA